MFGGVSKCNVISICIIVIALSSWCCSRGGPPHVTPLVLSTCEFWEVVDEMGVGDLLLEDVLLVEEEDDGGLFEPRICDDRTKESLRLLQAVLHETQNTDDDHRRRLRGTSLDTCPQ